MLGVDMAAKQQRCEGGRSFNCWRESHVQKVLDGKVQVDLADVYCYRCKVRMGCKRCVESAHDLICLECHNWATKAGVIHHGNVIPNPKQPRVRTDRGWQTQQDDRLNEFLKQFDV